MIDKRGIPAVNEVPPPDQHLTHGGLLQEITTSYPMDTSRVGSALSAATPRTDGPAGAETAAEAPEETLLEMEIDRLVVKNWAEEQHQLALLRTSTNASPSMSKSVKSQGFHDIQAFVSSCVHQFAFAFFDKF